MKKNTTIDLKSAREILILLHNSDIPVSITYISKTIDITYCYVFRTINYLEKEEMIKTEKKGRVRIVNLTAYGKKVAKACNYLKKVMR